MPTNFGTTPLSTTTIGANQFPASAVFVPGSGVAGNLTAVEGIQINTDANGFTTSPVRMGLLDGDDVTSGAKADAAVTGDTSGSHAAKLRGLNKILNDIWDSTNHLFAYNLKQVGGNAVSTAASGVQKVGITGNAGAAMDAAGQNAASPANELLIAGQFNTTPTTITSGNVSPLQLDANGNLLVNIKAGAAAGGTSATDEAAWTAGSSAFTPIGGAFNDSAAALTSGQQGTARLTNNRAIHVNLRDASANQLLGSKTSANSIPVVVASDQGAIPVSESGTWNVGSSTATGSAVPANAFYEGLLAKTALPSAATDGNLTGAMGDKFGRQVVLTNAIRDLVSPITQLTLTSTTTETTLIAAVASTFLDIVSLVVVNTSATVCQVDFRDSTAGTIRATHLIPPTDERGISLPVPLPQNTVNNNWTAKCGTSVASIIITGSYISNK